VHTCRIARSRLLRCARYIDLNPVRARMVDDPTHFSWSSCAVLCGGSDDPLLTLHPTQQALGVTDADRTAAYRTLLTEALNHEDFAAIRAYLQQQRTYGRDVFQTIVAKPGRDASPLFDRRIDPGVPDLTFGK
jgi:putative transposase